jgi:hypothetical protein
VTAEVGPAVSFGFAAYGVTLNVSLFDDQVAGSIGKCRISCDLSNM